MNQHPTQQQIEDLINDLQQKNNLPEVKPEPMVESDLNPWATPTKCKDCE